MALCLETYGDSRGVGVSGERGTLQRAHGGGGGARGVWFRVQGVGVSGYDFSG